GLHVSLRLSGADGENVKQLKRALAARQADALPVNIEIKQADFAERFAAVKGELAKSSSANLLIIDQFGIMFEQIVQLETTDVLFFVSSATFSLIGLYVGVIPVFLGICWLPALRRLGPGFFVFLMALTAGMLVYLGIDATQEALELREGIGDALQGTGLVGIGIAGSFLLLQAISRRESRAARGEAEQRTSLAFLISIGIGLHNFGEGAGHRRGL
ncbi:MAG: hypothetical protein M3480_06960, partial [Verrucomicrobiota bacterium]|nr:hypothetical protein [Verrucomicrobiota bacterium]